MKRSYTLSLIKTILEGLVWFISPPLLEGGVATLPYLALSPTSPHIALQMKTAVTPAILLLGLLSESLAYVVKIGLTAEAIGRHRWEQVVSPETSPFCEYDWIHSLEKSRYGITALESMWLI